MLGYPFFRFLYLVGSIAWFGTGISALIIMWNIGEQVIGSACK